MSDKKNIFNDVYKFFSRVVFFICVCFIVAFGGVRLIGLHPYVITSGSMIPEYDVGSIVYVQKVEPDNLKVGDDISFYLDDDVVATHRIRQIDKSNRCVKTYGINNKDSYGNQINDANSVGFDYIIGKVRFSLPVIGYVYLFVRTTTGKMIVLLVLAMIIICELLNFILKRRRDYGNKAKKS